MKCRCGAMKFARGWTIERSMWATGDGTFHVRHQLTGECAIEKFVPYEEEREEIGKETLLS